MHNIKYIRLLGLKETNILFTWDPKNQQLTNHHQQKTHKCYNWK